MAPVYSSAFAPPTTNKISAMGVMGVMVPAYFSMTLYYYYHYYCQCLFLCELCCNYIVFSVY